MATRAIIKRRPRIASFTTATAHEYPMSGAVADVLTQVAYVFFAALELLLIARFVLRLAGANPFHQIVTWVYNTTSFFVLPFESLFPSPNNDFSVLEVSTLIAMIFYLLVFYLAVAIFRLFNSPEEVVNPEGNY